MSTLVEGEPVELTGTVRLLGAPVLAPFTREPCVAHLSRARVFTQLDHVGDHVGDFDSFELAPCVLETARGAALVLERPAVIQLVPSPLGWVDDACKNDFLGPRQVLHYARSTFFEHVLVRDGDEVTMTGVITNEAAPALEAGFRDLPVRTRLTGYGRYPLTLG